MLSFGDKDNIFFQPTLFSTAKLRKSLFPEKCAVANIFDFLCQCYVNAALLHDFDCIKGQILANPCHLKSDIGSYIMVTSPTRGIQKVLRQIKKNSEYGNQIR